MANPSSGSDHLFMRERQKSFFGRTQLVYLVVSLLLVVFHVGLFYFSPLKSFENKVTDIFFKVSRPSQAPSQIAIIEMDSASLESIGRLPWPQHYYAEMIRLLDRWQAKSAIFDVFLEESTTYEDEDSVALALKETELDVYLPVRLEPKKEKKIWVHSLPVVLEPEGQGYEWVHSLKEVEKELKGLGHVNFNPDPDGVLRRVQPFLAGQDQVYSQLTLHAAYDFLNEPRASRYEFDFPIDRDGGMWIDWAGPFQSSFERYSFADLIRSEQALRKNQKPTVAPEALRGKVCLIGLTDEGKSQTIRTPIESKVPSLSLHANLLYTFLNQKPIQSIASKQGAFCLLGIGMLMILIFIFFRLRTSLIISFVMASLWTLTAFYLFNQYGLIVPVIHIFLLIATLFIFSVVYEQLISASEQTRLFDLATRDGLTGLYVIRHFREILNRVVGEVIQTKEPLSLILMDIDNFKPINDTYGHPAGDEVLKETAQVIFSCLRSKRKEEAVDYVGRYGGEEFIVLLRNVDLRMASQTVAERIRAAIERETYRWEGAIIPVTVSVGVSMLRAGEKVPDAMVHRADEALYEAKRTGKNRVCIKE